MCMFNVLRFSFQRLDLMRFKVVTFLWAIYASSYKIALSTVRQLWRISCPSTVKPHDLDHWQCGLTKYFNQSFCDISFLSQKPRRDRQKGCKVYCGRPLVTRPHNKQKSIILQCKSLNAEISTDAKTPCILKVIKFIKMQANPHYMSTHRICVPVA